MLSAFVAIYFLIGVTFNDASFRLFQGITPRKLPDEQVVNNVND